jgi:hypothetical protein
MENKTLETIMREYEEKYDSIIEQLERIELLMVGMDERAEDRVARSYQDFLLHSQEDGD